MSAASALPSARSLPATSALGALESSTSIPALVSWSTSRAAVVLAQVSPPSTTRRNVSGFPETSVQGPSPARKYPAASSSLALERRSAPEGSSPLVGGTVVVVVGASRLTGPVVFEG